MDAKDKKHRVLYDKGRNHTREIKHSLNVVVNALDREHINKPFKFST